MHRGMVARLRGDDGTVGDDAAGRRRRADPRRARPAAATLPANLAVTGSALLAPGAAPATAGGRRRPTHGHGQRRQDDQGAAAVPRRSTPPVIAWCWSSRASTAHRSPVLARGRRVPRRSRRRLTRLRRRAARDRPAEGVDVYVPVCSPVASLSRRAGRAAAGAVLRGAARRRRTSSDRLDDKYAFAAAAETLGLPVPDTHRITDPDQVAEFDFAARRRRLRPEEHRLRPGEPARPDAAAPRTVPDDRARSPRPSRISDTSPWILQAFVRGQEYCTHSTVRGTGACRCTAAARRRRSR